MAVFVYRMQNILDVKNKLETQAKTAYAQANQKVKDEEEILQTIYEDINRLEEKIREFSEGIVNVDELKWCTSGIQLKKQEAISQKRNIEKAKREAEIARIKLNEVMVERKTHEKLKEKAFEEFKQDLLTSEAKEVDELVSYNYNKSE